MWFKARPDEWWPFSQLFLLSKRKSWIPGIRLLSRLCLETRSSEFFARGRYSSSRVCFSRSPLLSTLVSIFFAFSFRRRKRQSSPLSPKLCTSTMFFNHVSTSLHRGRSVENLGEIFSSLRDAPVNILNFIDVTRYDLICY